VIHMATYEDKPWCEVEARLSPHEELFEAERLRLRHERALVSRARQDERERQRALLSVGPPTWPPAA
jgi:hypothetical protein